MRLLDRGARENPLKIVQEGNKIAASEAGGTHVMFQPGLDDAILGRGKGSAAAAAAGAGGAVGCEKAEGESRLGDRHENARSNPLPLCAIEGLVYPVPRSHLVGTAFVSDGNDDVHADVQSTRGAIASIRCGRPHRNRTGVRCQGFFRLGGHYGSKAPPRQQ